MTETFIYIAMLLTSFAGFFLLAASQQQHRTAIAQIMPYLTASPHRLHWAGFALLGASMILGIFRDGPAFGLLGWALTLSIAAFFVAASMTVIGGMYKRRTRRQDAPIGDD